jgi:hypothetical protein
MEIKARELVAPNFLTLFKAVLKHTFTEFCLVAGADQLNRRLSPLR